MYVCPHITHCVSHLWLKSSNIHIYCSRSTNVRSRGTKDICCGAIRHSNRQFEEEVLPGPLCGLSMNLSPCRCTPKRQSQDVSRPAGLSEPSCDNSPPLPIPQPSPLERRRAGQDGDDVQIRDFNAWRTLLKNPDPDPDVELNRILMSSICARLVFLHTSLPATPPSFHRRRPSRARGAHPSRPRTPSPNPPQPQPEHPHSFPFTGQPSSDSADTGTTSRRQGDPSRDVPGAYEKRDPVDLLSSPGVVEDQGSDNDE